LHVDNSREFIESILNQCQHIAENFWGMTNDYDCVLVGSDGWIDRSIIPNIFNTKAISTVSTHHECHAAISYYQSPFDKALIFSYDGGGDDGFFNVYVAEDGHIKHIKKIDSDFGGGYLLFGSLLKELCKNTGANKLSISGKLMGLCGYGTEIDDYVPAFSDFLFDKDYSKLSSRTTQTFNNLNDPWGDVYSNSIFDGQLAYDIAATAQKAFESAFFSVADTFVDMYPNYPICLSGGGSLNVLLNEEIKYRYGVPVFVPQAPNDCGLSLGHLLNYRNPTSRVDVTYSGIPLLDKDRLEYYVNSRCAKIVSEAELAKILKSGKIIGFISGDSEVGPRALGNRSIVCDPSYPNMKDILNSKVKFREWFRPFAPFCKHENAPLYFESHDFDNLECMSFAPMVKDAIRDKVPSITHIDGTSRLQTVSKDQHKIFYGLLSEFEKISDIGILLNTSFNIKGLPILSTIEDALYVLDNTEMDYVCIDNYLFGGKSDG